MKYKEIQKQHDKHLINVKGDHFLCTECYSFKKMAEKADPSTVAYKDFLEKNKGNIVLVPCLDNIYMMKLAILNEFGNLKETIFRTSYSDLSILPYLYKE